MIQARSVRVCSVLTNKGKSVPFQALDVVEERGLVLFDGEDKVRFFLLYQKSGCVVLGVERIGGDDHTPDIKRLGKNGEYTECQPRIFGFGKATSSARSGQGTPVCRAGASRVGSRVPP